MTKTTIYTTNGQVAVQVTRDGDSIIVSGPGPVTTSFPTPYFARRWAQEFDDASASAALALALGASR